MEKGTVIIRFLEDSTTLTIPALFSYIKKKTEDGNDMMLLSFKTKEHIAQLATYHGDLEIKGLTTANKKYPKGLGFTCSQATITRARKRIGYTEYLIVCHQNIIES